MEKPKVPAADGNALIPMTLDEVKTVELQMLREIDAFCRKHDIRYSLAYGTLLGAIRHHGFIPWDDDIDIMLPRDDYERFLREYPRSPGHRYRIDCAYYTSRSTRCFAKVTDPRTLLHEKSGNPPTGIFMDVFPIDGMVGSDRWQDLCYRLAHFFGTMLGYKYSWHKVSRRFLLLKYPLRLLAWILPGRFFHWAATGIPRGWFAFRCSKFAGCWWVRYGWRRERLPRKIFEEFTDLDFEGLTVRGISAWHDYLANLYGDYMKLPPESERVGDHLVEAFRISPETGK